MKWKLTSIDLKLIAGIFAFTIFLTSIWVDQSQAIPAFARKYKTSCVTCHTVYPKLNPFGEAFRINGFQFPVDEEEQIKDEPVKLGSDVYKRVWPDAIWPNSIPAHPFSIRGRIGFEVETVDSATTSEFGQPTLQILAAGTMGKDITLFVGAHLFEDGELGSLDRLYLKLDNMFTSFLPQHFLYLKFGQFIPEVVPFASTHRGLTRTPYAFNTYAPSLGGNFSPGHLHGGGPFGIENFQLGLEASGVVESRLRYVLGVVNGSGVEEDVNSEKDFYGRLSYKFGGLAFDGSGGENIDGKETSFALGLFGYNGTTVHDGENANFYRLGMDFNFWYSDFNFIGGYITGEDHQEEELKYNMYFVEGDYAIYPWLLLIMRYEQANPENEQNIKQLILNITSLYVANIKFLIETRINPDDSGFDNLYLGLDFAF
jgi:hypothetical protein